MDSLQSEIQLTSNANLNVSFGSLLGPSFLLNSNNNNNDNSVTTNEKNLCIFSDVSSINLEDNIEIFSCSKFTSNKSKKKKKRYLNITPIPLFDCIYCANEGVVFNHKIKKNLHNKYGKAKNELIISKLKLNLNSFSIKNQLINIISFSIGQHTAPFLFTNKKRKRHSIKKKKKKRKIKV